MDDVPEVYADVNELVIALFARSVEELIGHDVLAVVDHDHFGLRLFDQFVDNLTMPEHDPLAVLFALCFLHLEGLELLLEWQSVLLAQQDPNASRVEVLNGVGFPAPALADNHNRDAHQSRPLL